MFGIYLIIGAFAGIASGLFGIGGGIIIVPALAAIFTDSSFVSSAYIMQMAIGTSLATMILTSVSGGYSYFLRGALRWDKTKQFAPLVLVGVIIGALIANFLPSHYLKIIFAIFLIFISLRIFLINKVVPQEKFLPKKITTPLSLVIGAMTTILGAGGGTMLVPFFMRLNLRMQEAVGTSLAFSALISLVASICFMIPGLFISEKMMWTTGYIYWPAFAGIVITSVLFAPIGTAIAHQLSTTLLKRIFAVFLILVAFDMLIFPR